MLTDLNKILTQIYIIFMIVTGNRLQGVVKWKNLSYRISL